jgi:hypothetical protein
MNDRLNQFRQKYIEELAKYREANPGAGWNPKLTDEQKVDMMIAAINKGNREDWLKYNPVMKIAAAHVGIKKSPELREFIKASLASS